MATNQPSGSGQGSLWTNERARGIAAQIFLVGGLAAFVLFLVVNTNVNLEKAGLEIRFAFLADQAFFEINQNLIEYSSTSTFGRALLVWASEHSAGFRAGHYNRDHRWLRHGGVALIQQLVGFADGRGLR